MTAAHKLALTAAPADPTDTAETAALLAIQNSRTVHGVYTAQDFHTVAVSWDGRLLVLRGGGEIVGFCITSDTGRIGELSLRDESLFVRRPVRRAAIFGLRCTDAALRRVGHRPYAGSWSSV